MQMFLECLESTLGREVNNGFRGIQSKSLMDILQMECLSPEFDGISHHPRFAGGKNLDS